MIERFRAALDELKRTPLAQLTMPSEGLWFTYSLQLRRCPVLLFCEAARCPYSMFAHLAPVYDAAPSPEIGVRWVAVGIEDHIGSMEGRS